MNIRYIKKAEETENYKEGFQRVNWEIILIFTLSFNCLNSPAISDQYSKDQNQNKTNTNKILEERE